MPLGAEYRNVIDLENNAESMDEQPDTKNGTERSPEYSSTPTPPKPEKTNESELLTDVARNKENPTTNLKRQFGLLEILTAVFDGLLVAIGVGALCIYNGQLAVMRGTLEEVKRSGQESTQQVWRAIENINWLAREMNYARDQAVASAAANERNAKTALAASISAADRQWSTMRDQLEASERNSLPWIGLDNSGYLPVETFSEEWPPLLPNPSSRLVFSYAVRNFGMYPGFRETETIHWEPVPDIGKAMPSLREACLVDAYRGGQVTLKGDIGEMLLPGAIKPSGIDQLMAYGETSVPHHLHRIWVTLCVNYSDAKSGWHFSGYRYISHEPDGATPVLIPGHPDWSYVPIRGLSLVAADAN
ncbi:MAG TPA: hypothetical protein VMH05_06860 [Bryobacteraceae bacterium]|nr:hypothetical protein [Bryobacteraceae bacterium]